MEIVKTDAFVLKSFKYRDTSKIVTVFTKDYGKLKAIVKGVRNYKSRICGTMESMNYISAVIYLKENRDLQLITHAEYKKSFPGIVNDFEKLEAAFKIIELLNRSVAENNVNSGIFELLIQVFTEIEKSTGNHKRYSLFFLIRLSSLMGLSPEFTDNFTEHETFFSINEFYMSSTNFNTLLNFYKSSVDNIKLIDADADVINNLINNYERFISVHSQGLTIFNTNKVFQEINKKI